MNILEKNGKRYLNFLGIFLFLYILSRINFSDFFNKLPQINLWLILLLPPLIIIINLIKAWRWRIMLSRQNINYPFTQIILIYLSGIFFGAITPGRIGELGRLYYLKKDQHSTFNSLTTLILDKVLDLILALILGVAGLFIYSRYLHINQTYISVFIVLLILFLLFNHHAP
ncbi:MAG: lysylphosphatidylglycerol synthase transmembrane domain-containing protein, partial [Candidatus Falkowbacteria bacterium]|nr:lysylphosphatidylglycerol synthase transmembrane domain-containing protein [Candidatus Falkowbacteria bacterium]